MFMMMMMIMMMMNLKIPPKPPVRLTISSPFYGKVLVKSWQLK